MTVDFSARSGVSDHIKCAVYTPPLCHPGVCEDTKFANSTVEVFVHQISAQAIKPTKARNVWLLQGGPLHSPSTLDLSMWYLYEKLERKANVYTMDYRGTGRSTLLTCETYASTTVTNIDPTKVPDCAQELQDKYGDLAAFSTTSAANDLVNFLSDYTNDAGTTIYGFGYGTMWVERVIHLAPPKVTGYVLDNVMTTTGVKSDKFFYETSASAYAGEIGNLFFSLCADNSACNARFKQKGIEATIQHLMTKFDKKPMSTCAKVVKTLNSGQDDDPPSFVLRYLLGALLLDSSTRTLLPPVVYRFLRCSSKDVDVLQHFMTAVNQGYQLQGGANEHTSPILDNLVLFSEKWEVPTPSVSKLKAQFEEYLLNAWAPYIQVPQYCAFSKEKSRVCNKLNLGEYDGNGIIYERDEYWHKPATIPNQASVLLLSSKMDHLAPYQYAKFLLDALDGDNKEMITFQYTAGGNLVNAGTGEELCGLILLSSFVLNNGDLDYLDKSCVSEEKTALNFTLPINLQYSYLSTDDAYDGIYDSSLNASLY
ncbi:Serine protease [Phytophthora megakarya]|uniref:Serine protease n=1 Tax=Phytophthora megakarya TaxID=4795 RepID=A0A225X0J2_9STRA|nr:Serine protease [Phytophthora megakarya]